MANSRGRRTQERAAHSTGRNGGIAAGMCAWLGTCNRPRADHEERTSGPDPSAVDRA